MYGLQPKIRGFIFYQLLRNPRLISVISLPYMKQEIATHSWSKVRSSGRNIYTIKYTYITITIRAYCLVIIEDLEFL